MDDAFTLLRRAVDLLSEDAAAENGQTVGDVREDIGRQEWEMVLGVLIEIGDVHPVTVDFWELLAEAARQMMLDRSCRWCEWRAWEVQHGTVRATLGCPVKDLRSAGHQFRCREVRFVRQDAATSNTLSSSGRLHGRPLRTGSTPWRCSAVTSLPN